MLPTMCRRRMFAMMHIRNFCEQVSIEEVRQVISDHAFGSRQETVKDVD